MPGLESFSSGLFFQAEDGIRHLIVTGVQTCALPISKDMSPAQAVGLRGDLLVCVSDLREPRRGDAQRGPKDGTPNLVVVREAVIEARGEVVQDRKSVV